MIKKVLILTIIKHVDILLKVQKRYKKRWFKMLKTKNGRSMLLPQCAVCGKKISIFIKGQKAKGLLSSIDLKTPLFYL